MSGAIGSRTIKTPLTKVNHQFTIGTGSHIQFDQIGEAFEWTNFAATAGGTSIIDHILLVDIGEKSVQARIFFLQTNDSANGDDTPFVPTDQEAEDDVETWIDTTGYDDIGGQTLMKMVNIGEPITCATGSTSIWVVIQLEQTTAYTPIANHLILKSKAYQI